MYNFCISYKPYLFLKTPNISDFFDYKNIKNGDIEMPLDDTPEKRQIQFKAKFASFNPSGGQVNLL